MEKTEATLEERLIDEVIDALFAELIVLPFFQALDTSDLSDKMLSWSQRLCIFSEYWGLIQHPECASFVEEKFRDAAKKLMEAGLYFVVEDLYKTLSQDASAMFLVESRRRGVGTLIGKHDVTLRTAIAYHGEPEEIDLVLALEKGQFGSTHGKASEAFSSIDDLISRYTVLHDLPPLRDHQFLLPTVVRQIYERRYDLVVGILGAGSTIPNYLHPLDQRVAYIEWHKDWDSAPAWRSPVELRRGMRILLCENDAYVGATLQEVAATITPYSPSVLDVCFTGTGYGHSKSVSSTLGLFNSITHLTEFCQDRVYTDMLKYRERLLEVALD